MGRSGSRGYSYNKLEDKEPLVLGSALSTPGWNIIRVPFRHVARVTVSLPLLGFIFCVFWALYIDALSATATHCHVTNYLPSVSAATGDFPLSKFIWRLCIGIHAGPRFIVAGMYYRYLRSVVYQKYMKLSLVTCLLNVVENIALLGLTFISSDDDYPTHEKCFITFLFTSTLYMIILCSILTCLRNIPPTELESKSLGTKTTLVFVHIFCMAMACYTFVRHNTYCEDGMYTLFALMEYMVIVTNMSFHMTAYWDFYDRVLTIDFTRNGNQAKI